MKIIVLLCLAVLSVLVTDAQRNCTGDCQTADVNARMNRIMYLKEKEHAKCVAEGRCPTVKKAVSNVQCENGKAGEYDCSNVDLLSFVPLLTLGCGGDANDIWGWTDPVTNKEYAIIGCADGTSFVDVTDPENPVVKGFLRTHTFSSLWRDIKVYNNYAFIGSEASNHGMQVYDLTKLRDSKQSEDIRVLKADAHYAEFGNSHNMVINEDTGFAYAVGSRTCRSGLHAVNIKDPQNPQFIACFEDDGYVHDAQCVVYNGPDREHQGKEICFCYNENTLTIVDVEDKANMKALSRTGYTGYQYTHQGWLNEEQTHLLLDDELDELYGSEKRTRTLIFDVTDLESPKLINSFYSEETASDHNLYIIGNLAYQANYCAGLRILDVSEINDGILKEVGYFDVAPDCNTPGFNGAWSSYPYFNSGTIILSSIERGLFVLKYTGRN